MTRSPCSSSTPPRGTCRWDSSRPSWPWSTAPLPLAGSGETEEKVVDVGIQRTLDALASRAESGHRAQVLLGSHDGDYIPQVERLLAAGAYVGVLCFREFLNAQLAALEENGLVIHDLEQDVDAFTSPLPRVRIIPLDEFDPLKFI